MPPQGDLQLSIGYWLVSHKETLRKWWAISLLAIIALSFLWGAVFTIIFYSQSPTIDRQLSSRLSDLSHWSSVGAHAPAVLTVDTATAIPRDQTHIGLVATITNPNIDWGASAVMTHFVVNGKAQPSATTFLNPSDHRPIIALNVAVTDSTQVTASLVLDDTTWVKAASAALPAPNFVVDSADLTPTTVSINGQSIATVSLKAQVTNRSVYNYRHVDVPIVILNGTTPVAVDLVTTDNWPTLTAKTITSSWAYPLVGDLTAVVTPQVSRFDQNNTYR